jgi:hypothetical protein
MVSGMAMTDAERAELWERSHRLLQESGEMLEQSYARSANKENGVLPERWSPPPREPDSEPPLVRAEWTAERIEAILDARMKLYVAGIGEALGRIRQELRTEFAKGIADLKGELRTEAAQQTLARLEAMAAAVERSEQRMLDLLAAPPALIMKH